MAYSEGVDDPRASTDDSDDGVDVTLIRWMLSLSPSERLDVLQGFADSVAELRLDQDDPQIP